MAPEHIIGSINCPIAIVVARNTGSCGQRVRNNIGHVSQSLVGPEYEVESGIRDGATEWLIDTPHGIERDSPLTLTKFNIPTWVHRRAAIVDIKWSTGAT